MHALLSVVSANPLAVEWRRRHAAEPHLQPGDAASALDVVEAELVASLCGAGVLRLEPPFGDLVRVLPTLGRVRAVTRGPHACIETRGAYPPSELGCAGVAGEVGARFRLDRWTFGYAADEATGIAGGPALLFYDRGGEPVHALHPEPETDHRAWAKLVDVFASFDQSSGETIAMASPDASHPHAESSAWLRQAEAARPVPRAAVASVLEAARRDAIPVSVAVHSAGVAQRFSGLLHEVAATPARLEIRAPWVHAWIAADRLAEVWLVRTPSLDGPLATLHLLDANARVVASIAGARWPGKGEPSPWKDLVDRLEASLN